MLLVDYLPGSYNCEDDVESPRIRRIDGTTVRSQNTYSDSLCVLRFAPHDDGQLPPKRLMLNFKKFRISDPDVQLDITETSSSDVCSFHCFIVFRFQFVNQISFDILNIQ